MAEWLEERGVDGAWDLAPPLVAAGLPLLEEDKDDKVLVWPDLVYTELICLILATAGLIVWGIVAKAPLEQPVPRIWMSTTV
jgi:hypothetical protein